MSRAVNTGGDISYLNNGSFNTSNGELTLNVLGQANVVVDLDNRYLTDLPDAGIGAGTYGSTSDATKIDQITIDAKGRVTAITTGSTGDISGYTITGDTGSETFSAGAITTNFVGGTNVTTAYDSGTNTLTINSTGGGGGTPGGSDNQVQFNNSGAFGGSANFTWDDTTMNVNGQITATDSGFPVMGFCRQTTVSGSGLASTTGIGSAMELVTQKTNGALTDGFGGGFIFTINETGNFADSSYLYRIYARRDGADTQGALQFWAGSSSQTITHTFRNSGDTGFGTVNPRGLLHLQRNTTFTSPLHVIEQIGTGDSFMEITRGTTSYAFGIDQSDSDLLKLTTDSGNASMSSTEIMTFDSSTADVSIGSVLQSGYKLTITDSQTNKLALVDSNASGSNEITFFNNSGSNERAYILSEQAGITHGVAGDWEIRSGASIFALTQRVFISGSTGYVGIGNNESLDAPLHIQDSSVSTVAVGVKIENTNGDAKLWFKPTAVQDWSLGVDNSSSKFFVLNPADALDFNTAPFRVDSGGVDSTGTGYVKSDLRQTAQPSIDITSNYTVDSADAGRRIKTSGSSNININFTTALSTWEEGACIEILHTGTGTCTITDGASVTILTHADDTLVLDGQYSHAVVQKTDGTNEWIAFGRLTPA